MEHRAAIRSTLGRAERQGSGLRWYLNGPPRDWLQGRSPLLTALGMKDDASGKILAAQFFPSETAEGYFHCKFLVGIEIGKLSAAIQNA